MAADRRRGRPTAVDAVVPFGSRERLGTGRWARETHGCAPRFRVPSGPTRRPVDAQLTSTTRLWRDARASVHASVVPRHLIGARSNNVAIRESALRSQEGRTLDDRPCGTERMVPYPHAPSAYLAARTRTQTGGGARSTLDTRTPHGASDMRMRPATTHPTTAPTSLPRTIRRPLP